MKLKHFIPIFVLAIMLIGCKKKQMLPTQMCIAPARPNIYEIVEQTIAEQPNFKTMNISKFAMSLELNSNRMNMRGSLRLITDSLLSISIQPALGIELARIDFTPSTFKVYDKISRRYSENSYEYLKLKYNLPLTFQSLQAFFSHQIFSIDSTDPEVLCRKFDLISDGDTCSISAPDTVDSMTLRFDIDNRHRIVRTAFAKNDRLPYSVTYGSLQQTNKINYPSAFYITTDLVSAQFEANVNIEKITFNYPIENNSVNTSRYTKVAFSDIINFVKQ